MSAPTDDAHRAVLLDERVAADAQTLRRLRDGGVAVLDRRDAQRAELATVVPRPGDSLLDDPGLLAYYPWRRTVVGVLGPQAFRLLRLDRNRNKITRAEQQQLARLTVGVVGLSVGHAVAHTLALEGLCGALRLADFDTVDLSNLNRIPATVFDLGVNKSVVAARRIAELDPYLQVTVHQGGLTSETMEPFCDGLDVLVEECDSLDIKVLLRELARARGIPVLMETSDRGLLDVERFDLEPDRPIFHGLLGQVDARAFVDLSTKDKAPHVMRILDAPALSSRMAASMVEVGQSLTTWPQLGGDVALGGAVIATALRRLGLGQPLPSGRVRIDVEDQLAALAAPTVALPVDEPELDATESQDAGATGAAAAVRHAIRRAPSGGNIQPWRVEVDENGLQLHLAPERTTTMDVAHRGSYVALGAALYNARVAAAAAGVLGPVELFPDPAAPNLVATMHFGTGSDPQLARHAPAVLARSTNRGHGQPQPLSPQCREDLADAAIAEGAALHLLEPGSGLEAAGELLAAADRLRYLTPALHREMFAELSWPGRDTLDVGIDVRTLGLDEADLTRLTIAGRPEVMELLEQWGQGHALGEDTRDRVRTSSALAVVTVAGAEPEDFLRGGAGAEAVWVRAEEHGLGVHPVSPVFLFGLDAADRDGLSATFADELADLQTAFRAELGVGGSAVVALVLRLSHAAATPVRSRRLALRSAQRGAADGLENGYAEYRDGHPG
ncbi:MAG: Rv1355c family protein [Mycobacteriaceae bacterium]